MTKRKNPEDLLRKPRAIQPPTHGEVARGYKWARKICSCEECFKLDAAEQKRYAYRKALGKVSGKVPTYIARKMIKEQLVGRRGMTLVEIASATGYSREQINLIVGAGNRRDQSPKNVRSDFMDKLEKLEKETRGRKKFGTRARGDYVAPDRAQRAVHGLNLQGYTCEWIANRVREKTGKPSNPKHIAHIQCGTYNATMAWLDAALAEIASEVGFTQGPSTRVAAAARRKGYKPLLEWDDLL